MSGKDKVGIAWLLFIILLGIFSLAFDVPRISYAAFNTPGFSPSSGGGGLASSSIAATAPITVTPSASSLTFAISPASASNSGSISLGDFQLIHAASTTFSSPLIYTLGTNAVTLQAASASQNGYFSLGDFQLIHGATTTFSSPIVYTLGTNSATVQVSSASQNGYLSLGDFQLIHSATTTFSSPLVYTIGTNAVTLQAASASLTGSMASGDFNLLHTATTTFSSPLSYSLGTNAVTCASCLTSTFAYPWTYNLLNTFSTSTNSTSTSYWTQGAYFSSSTKTASQFPYASTTAISSTNASTTNLEVSGTAIFDAGNVGIATTSPASIFSINNIANFGVSTTTLYNYLNLTWTSTKTNCVSYNGICDTPRWIAPYHGGFDTAATTFTGVATTFYYSEFETTVPVVVDQVCYQVGGTQTGNVQMAIYGPLVTEESIVSAPIMASTTSTGQGSINSPQCLSIGPLSLGVGRFFVGLQGDNLLTFMREGNATTISGWTGNINAAYGALPPTATSSITTGNNIPAFKIRTVKPS